MKSSTRRAVFSPLAFGGRQGSIRVTRVLADGDVVRADVALEEVVVDAAAATEVSLWVEYTLPSLGGLVPRDESDASQLRVVLQAHEAVTWLRQSVQMVVEEGVARATLVLRMEDVREVVALSVVVARATARPGGDGRAWERGGRLVGSQSLMLRFRERPTRVGSFMSVRWQSFESEPSLKPWVGLPWALLLSADPPVLWLNTDLTAMVHVLKSRGTQGKQATLREVLFRTLATHVWTQLFDDATRGLDWDDDGSVRFGRSWHEHVLRQVARHAYSDRPRAQRLPLLLGRAQDAHTARDPHGLSMLAEDAARGVAQWMELGRRVERAAVDLT